MARQPGAPWPGLAEPPARTDPARRAAASEPHVRVQHRPGPTAAGPFPTLHPLLPGVCFRFNENESAPLPGTSAPSGDLPQGHTSPGEFNAVGTDPRTGHSAAVMGKSSPESTGEPGWQEGGRALCQGRSVCRRRDSRDSAGETVPILQERKPSPGENKRLARAPSTKQRGGGEHADSDTRAGSRLRLTSRVQPRETWELPPPEEGRPRTHAPREFHLQSGEDSAGSPALVPLPREQPSEGTVVVSDPFLTWSQEFNLRAQTSFLCDSEQDIREPSRGRGALGRKDLCPDS